MQNDFTILEQIFEEKWKQYEFFRMQKRRKNMLRMKHGSASREENFSIIYARQTILVLLEYGRLSSSFSAASGEKSMNFVRVLFNLDWVFKC